MAIVSIQMSLGAGNKYPGILKARQAPSHSRNKQAVAISGSTTS